MRDTRIHLHESSILGEKYYHIAHKSGLNIYLFPKNFTTAYALFAVKFGGADRAFRFPGEGEFTAISEGTAHFLEHKLFEREDGTDTFELFAQTGASANAFTSALSTAYLFSCTENFDDSLRILLEMVTHPHFTEESVKKELGIITQEILMGEDSPSQCLYYGMIRSLYAEHPLRVSVAGSAASISSLTPEILYACHRAFYNLNNMGLFICGNVSVDSVIAAADVCLTEASPFSAERIPFAEPKGVASPRFYKEMQVAKPLFSVGVKDCPAGMSPRDRMFRQCTMDIINDVLFSRAAQWRNLLYKEGVTGSSLSYGYCICDSFAYNALSGEASDPEEFYGRYTAYLEHVKRVGLDANSFERCRRVQYANCVASYDDTAEIAHSLMDMVLDGEELLAEPEIIASITLDDANRILREVFVQEQTVMAVVAPLGYKRKGVSEE